MQPRIPRLVHDVDVKSLPLSSTEGFVLSRIDGEASVDDISVMTGVEPERLLRILERLAELGVLELPWTATGAGAARRREVTSEAPTIERERDESSELEEPGVEIPLAVRRVILDAYHSLAGKDHYALLGVPPTADRAQIRAAYFELARVFHPDSQFGKELGSFKLKMEHVFGKLAEAYEVLRRANKRAEYDEYLALSRRTRESLAGERRASRTGRRISRSLADDYERQARYEEKAGDWQAAAESWVKVSDARPEDAAAARSAAEAMLKARDLRRAQRYAQKAVRLRGSEVANLVVLARVYLDAGLRPNAQRELEKAAKLDPRDEMVKNLLREAR